MLVGGRMGDFRSIRPLNPGKAGGGDFMIYIGIDVHKKMCVVTIKRSTKETLKTTEFPNTKDGILGFINDIQDEYKEECRVVCESTGNYWILLHDLLEDHGIDTLVAHPEKTKAIAWAKLKNDKVDSGILADLNIAGLVYESFVPNSQYKDLRSLGRNRQYIVNTLTKTKNKIRAILAKYGYECPARDVLAVKAIAWLKEIDVSPVDRIAIDMHIDTAELALKQIAELQQKMASICSNDKRAKLLMTIPGINYVTALTIIAEIVDVKRFPSAEKLTAAAGLIPSEHSSGGIIHRGAITKKGSVWLRNAMVEAANTAIRHDERMNKIYNRLWPRIGKQKARVAVARHLLEICWHMLTKNEEYRTQNHDLTKRKYKQMERATSMA